MFRISGLMLNVLYYLPDELKGSEGRMRLKDIRNYLNKWLCFNISREYSRQAINQLVKEGFADCICVNVKMLGGDKRGGVKWFGLTPMGVIRAIVQ